MNYPLISEYIESIRAVEGNFADLNYLRPVLDDAGNPESKAEVVASEYGKSICFFMKPVSKSL